MSSQFREDREITDPNPDAPTSVAPTELGDVIDGTEANTAWSLDDAPDDDLPRRRLTPSRIAGLAVTASAVAFITVVGAAAWVILRDPRASAPSPDPTTLVYMPTDPEQHGATAPPSVPGPHPIWTATPTPSKVTLPSRGGIAYVGTRSGKTACEITYGNVTCNIAFVVATPIRYGTRANLITMSSHGEWDWGIGDRGQQEYPPMDYGQTYSVLGWTIKPTSADTTFINDTTGHGMTVSVEGVMPF